MIARYNRTYSAPLRIAEADRIPFAWRRVPAFVLALALACLLATPAKGQGDPNAASGLSGSIRVYPGSFWSSTMGVGIGVGYELEGITGSTSSLLFVAKPSIHRGIYEASYVTRDPYGGTPFIGLAAYYETTGRTRYYGVGPYSDSERRVFIEDDLLRLRLRAGFPPGDGAWIIQPVAEFWTVAVDSFRNDDDEAYEAMSDRSQQVLRVAEGADGAISYAALGLELGRFFTRDRSHAGSGVQATAEWFHPVRSDGRSFVRVGGHVQLDEPIGPRQLLARMAFAAIIDGSDDVPYFLLPRLGGRLMPGLARDRLRGDSFFVVNLGVEQPIINLFDYAGLDLVLMASVGNVYNDFIEQFSPRISFDDRLSPDGRVPLRPAIAGGFRVFFGERPFELTVLAGTSPERLSVVTFRIHRDIRHRQGLLFR